MYAAHFDILGMSSLLQKSTYEAWLSLVDLADASRSEELPISDESRSTLNERFFSDTIIIRTRDDDLYSLHTILARSFELFRCAFRSGIPLRGGVAHGDWVENNEGQQDLFTGQALLSAYCIGESQQLLSVAVCDVTKKRFLAEPFELTCGRSPLIDYEVPIKDGKYCKRALLNWPVFCEHELRIESSNNGPWIAARFGTFGNYDSLKESVKKKYNNTATFIEKAFTPQDIV